MTQSAIRRWTLMAAAAVILMAAGNRPNLAASGSPGESRVIDDRYIVRLGSYLTDFTTDAAVGSGGVIGTFIRVEDDLGLTDDESVFRLDGIFRFNRRHSIGVGYWGANRDGSAILTEDIDFDGNIYEAGVGLESKFDTKWLRIDWRYSFHRSDRGEAGFSAGISFYDFDIALAGTATIDDGINPPIKEFARAEEDIIAPVPTIGFFINFAITPNLVFRFKTDFLDLDIDEFEGNALATEMLFEWYFSHHVGVGAGMSISDLTFKDTGEQPWSVDYHQSGLVAYFTFAFGEVD